MIYTDNKCTFMRDGKMCLKIKTKCLRGANNYRYHYVWLIIGCTTYLILRVFSLMKLNNDVIAKQLQVHDTTIPYSRTFHSSRCSFTQKCNT